MFSDADLLGTPVRVIVSPRNMSEGIVEISTRDKTIQLKTPLDNAAAKIQEIIRILYAAINEKVRERQ